MPKKIVTPKEPPLKRLADLFKRYTAKAEEITGYEEKLTELEAWIEETRPKLGTMSEEKAVVAQHDIQANTNIVELLKVRIPAQIELLDMIGDDIRSCVVQASEDYVALVRESLVEVEERLKVVLGPFFPNISRTQTSETAHMRLLIHQARTFENTYWINSCEIETLMARAKEMADGFAQYEKRGSVLPDALLDLIDKKKS